MFQRFKIVVLLGIADKEYDLNGFWVNSKTVNELVISRCTIGKILEIIRQHHQMDIYTVNDVWCVQLLELSDCANDQKSCIYEDSSQELIDVLFECVLYVIENMDVN